jgi:hypothetical protein
VLPLRGVEHTRYARSGLCTQAKPTRAGRS